MRKQSHRVEMNARSAGTLLRPSAGYCTVQAVYSPGCLQSRLPCCLVSPLTFSKKQGNAGAAVEKQRLI